ncbi:efflux RND transporter periplasmic adaptor subunit [Bacillus sp. HMF5848]|uniref:efflux RND transporter periplasmic adaptor subunit n=1 Tax=Bacillus sp. HMF5848 TaxID=2495421 RepID=UPI000F767EF1|nr:efflux RND transporter periplasmic adaptor subunit [Bacillus sp. HMF5848]RSK28646.1 efflux RND transporter periplasmic adaptor subunit [Bacillus sp. HMF5848]
MKQKQLAGLSLAILLALAGCGQAATTSSDVEEKVTPVKVEQVTKGSLTVDNEIVGQAQANMTLSVFPKIAGELVELNVSKGDFVEKGAVLAKVNTRDLEIGLNSEQTVVSQAQGQVKQAQIQKNQAEDAIKNAEIQLQTAELSYKQATEGSSTGVANSDIAVQQAEQNYNNAKTNYDRTKALFEDGIVSKQQFEQAESALKQAELGLEQAKLQSTNAQSPTNLELAAQQVEQAKMALANAKRQVELANVGVQQAQVSLKQAQLRSTQAQARLDDATLVAPEAGYIMSITSEPGEIVSSAQPLFTIVNVDPMKVSANISANQLAMFNVDETVTVAVPLTGSEAKATISFVSPAADQAGLYTVEATITNPPTELKPGMPVNFVIEESLVNDAVLVPTGAIIVKGGQSYVFVVDGETAVQTPVEVIQSQTETTAVRVDLAAGTQVVVKGQNTLVDGNKVRIMEEE